jgi:hypothetical protein
VVSRQSEVHARLTPEQKARMAAGNDSAKGKKARAASPWNKAPMCGSERAAMARMRYVAKSKANPRPK